MKVLTKAILCISLSLMCIFACIGYAAQTTELFIQGNATLPPPNALYISDVSGGNYIDPDTLAYAGTVVTSDVTMRLQDDGQYGASYRITVFNNTNVSYYYLAMVRGTYTDENGTEVAYSNDNVEMSVDITLGDEVKPGEKKYINVTVKFKEGVTDTSDVTLFSMIDYQFSTTKPEASDEAAVAGVLTRFPEILNTPSEYETLTNAMNQLSSSRLSSSYIGNVVGANDNDSVALQNLFGEALTLNIDGEDKPVTVMIKRENIDGSTGTGDNFGWFNRGVEMTLYITADPLTSSGAYVPVYAVSYTMNQSTGEWYLIGGVFKGTAKVRNYGGISSSGKGSFDTDTWRDENGKTIENLV